MNDIVSFGGNANTLPANPSDLAAGLQNVGMAINSMASQPILRLLRDGIFVFGQENIEVEAGSEWAVNPYSIEHGFACWGDSELLGEVMVPLTQAPPPVNTLPDHGQPWAQQISMHLKCMNGEDQGVTVIYKSTSKGFMGMAKQMCSDIINQLQKDPAHIVPLVTLEHDHYKHKKYGKIYTPILEIQQWLSIDTAAPAETAEEVPPADDGDEDIVVDESPRTAAPEVEETEQDEPEQKTQRRRRRRA